MKKIITGFLLSLTAVFIFTACKKFDSLPFYANGTVVTLSTSTTTITPTPADSLNAVVTFSWTSPHYATDSSTYKFLLEIDSSGRNFSDKTLAKDVSGALTASLTGKELNAILLNYGFTIGTPVTLDARIVSSYANNNEQYISNIVNLTVTPYGDSSVLMASKDSVTCDINTASEIAIDFDWTPSFNGYAGEVTYTLQYDSVGGSFASPHEIAIGPSTYTKSLTQGEINETAISSGVVGGTKGTVEYRIKASTALGAIVYSNAVAVAIQSYESILRFYMPGSYQAATGNGNDWDPGTAPELIRDLRTGLFNNMYYIYIWLPAGAQFKVTQGRDWAINYGGTGGNLARDGANFSVADAGVYRITIDRSALKYDIKVGRMGFVGGAVTGVDWNPGAVFPTSAMAYTGVDQFLGLYNFGTGGWKMIDNDQWNNGSNSVDETRSYGSNGGSGSTLDVNAENMPDIATAGLYRVLWNGTDPNNIKYEMYQGLRVVGGFQGWNPDTAPDMTYQGNGIWKIHITLSGEFKFVSANGWAFNYGGANDKLVRDGPNLSVSDGTYDITVDEYNQTYTIQ